MRNTHLQHIYYQGTFFKDANRPYDKRIRIKVRLNKCVCKKSLAFISYYQKNASGYEKQIKSMYAVVHEEMLNSLDHLDDEIQGLVLLAYTKYLLYGVEPSKDNQLVYSLFKAKQFDLNNSRTRAEVARENGKKGGRPRKDFTVQNTEKTKITQPKPNDNPEKPRTKNKEQIKENIKRKEFGEYVSLSDDEYTKLTDLYGDRVIKDFIERLNYWIGEKPTKDRLNRKSYFTLLNRLKRAEEKGEIKKIQQTKQGNEKIENLRDSDIYLQNLFKGTKENKSKEKL